MERHWRQRKGDGRELAEELREASRRLQLKCAQRKERNDAESDEDGQPAVSGATIHEFSNRLGKEDGCGQEHDGIAEVVLRRRSVA